ncbi:MULTISPECIES: hypothetical protein [unclassified Streptomyces]|nr:MULTISPECIES: hypothetical protein [unclassified Streptomyces]
MALVNSPTSFYTLRFLLGAAEAGFFPGVILYLLILVSAPAFTPGVKAVSGLL